MKLLTFFIILLLCTTTYAQQISVYEVTPHDWLLFSEMEKEIFIAQSIQAITTYGKEKFVVTPNVMFFIKVLDTATQEVKDPNATFPLIRLLYHSLKDSGYFEEQG